MEDPFMYVTLLDRGPGGFALTIDNRPTVKEI